ncbi:bifunctional diguanylate cyclase/phosphodiesterase [Micromonospora sp. WMMD1082]|uniref:bifunctional diguanylate cyclase/phosphodiesterase n=1 Tax=Micromonospora sp. WMMD1082 TaxID=3016104 RepID=UPI002417CA21|nr:bifunctional diguanylate cyclase/phosphodiesterase [Micromonospora sp. WMMD1082]MDG4792638.1 bifunctional diguanylate cyclase/phosphodiesterase [Micromonospora sp. WMMD1082]
MPVPSVFRAAPSRAAYRPILPEICVLAVTAVLVVLGATGHVPALAVVALAGAAASTLAGVRLSRLTLGPDSPAAGPPAGRMARRAAARPRRAAALLHAAVVTAGLTAAVLPLASAGYRPAATVAGLAGTTALLGGGLLSLPRRPRPPARRWPRQLLDGAPPGLCLVLAAWLLLPYAGVPAPVRLVVAVAVGVLAVDALTVLTGARRRSGVARCRAGAALTLLALVLLAALPAGPAAGRAALLVVPSLVAGVLLVAAGVRGVVRGDASRQAPWVWPRAVVPAVAVVLAIVHQLQAGLLPDRTAVLLALAAVPSLVARELLGGAGSAPAAAPDPPAAPPPVAGTVAPAPALADVGVPAGRAALLRALAERPEPASGTLLVVDLHLTELPGPVVRDDVGAEAVRRARAVAAEGDEVFDLTGSGLAVVTGVGPVLAYALGTRLLTALGRPYEVSGAALRSRPSIGLAELTRGRPEDVLRQADLARRRAAQLGRDRVEWYDAYLEEQLVRRLDLERELPGAVARGELDLVYQPVLALADRSPVGTEALLRWRNPALGTVFPAELLPVAEDLDIVGELGAWVLDRACRQLADWSVGRRGLWMAVNVTARELTSPDFVPRTAAVLEAYGVGPDQLVVEVAEPRVAAELPTVVARLAGLRSMGIRTALDDFRAEHASLAQLRRLPIDLLKVGPEASVAGGDPHRPLLDVVVTVADRLGLEVVAEELESAHQVEGAHRAGCRYGQGFELARPATAERVEAYFEEFPSTSR